MIQLRIRGPTGLSSVSLPETATVDDLKAEIKGKTGLETFDLKHGYPPQHLDFDELPLELTLAALQENGVELNRQQLIASPKTNSMPSHVPPYPARTDTSTQQHNGHATASAHDASKTSKPQPSEKAQYDPPEIELPPRAATLVLRVMPDDNSCMFRALSSAVLTDSLDGMTELRSLVAQGIQSDPINYSAAILGKSPDKYCRWIQSENSWGGGIELSILSQYFGIEICSVNVQDGRVDRFNEGAARRCILIYSGIHYDVVALVPSSMPTAGDVKMFESDDDATLVAAVELCEKLKARHYYTDTAGFTVKCNKCGWQGTGEQGALTHATETGHYDFGEA
ncbi:MAG: ubiquitin-specific protease otu1 [Chrysothrix sp. TS-e1954]|nr:MAG: ubiquitin-specific protease otu1 [Chrysothrix sp. TS-e1954]